MRVMTSVTVVSACLLLHGQPAAADGIGGWPLLNSGMSKKQVEHVYPNFEDWDQPGYFTGATGLVKRFGLQTYNVAGCTFSMYLEFLDNRLERIQLDAFAKKGGLEERSCRRVKDALSEKYGQATPEEPQIPGSPSVKWTMGETEISYTDFLPSQRSEYFWIIVVYTSAVGWSGSRNPGKTAFRSPPGFPRLAREETC